MIWNMRLERLHGDYTFWTSLKSGRIYTSIECVAMTNVLIQLQLYLFQIMAMYTLIACQDKSEATVAGCSQISQTYLATDTPSPLWDNHVLLGNKKRSNKGMHDNISRFGKVLHISPHPRNDLLLQSLEFSVSSVFLHARVLTYLRTVPNLTRSPGSVVFVSQEWS